MSSPPFYSSPGIAYSPEAHCGGITLSQTSFGLPNSDTDVEAAANTLLLMSQSEEDVSSTSVQPATLVSTTTTTMLLQPVPQSQLTGDSASSTGTTPVPPTTVTPANTRRNETAEEKKLRKRLRNKQLAKESRDRRKKKFKLFERAYFAHADKMSSIEAMARQTKKDGAGLDSFEKKTNYYEKFIDKLITQIEEYNKI